MTTYYAEIPGATDFRTADLSDDTAAVAWAKAAGATGVFRRSAEGDMVELNLGDPDGLWPLAI